MSSSNPRFKGKPDGYDQYKYMRGQMNQEVFYRREQQWKVFSWISGLLLALIGGIVAIRSNNSLSLMSSQRIALTVGILIFSGFGILWIRHEQSLSEFYSQTYYEFDKEFGLELDSDPYKKRHLSYNGFLVLVSLLTIAVVWFV